VTGVVDAQTVSRSEVCLQNEGRGVSESWE
jgi:hypothetical protein